MHGFETIVGHVFLFLTTIATFVFKWKRDERNHRWQQEAMRELSQQVTKNGRARE